MKTTATKATAQHLTSVRASIEKDDTFQNELINITEQLVYRPDYMFQVPLVKAVSKLTGKSCREIQDSIITANFPDAYSIYIHFPRLNFTVKDIERIKMRFKNHQYHSLFEEVKRVDRFQGLALGGLMFSVDPRFLPQQILPSILKLRVDYGKNPIIGRRNASSADQGKRKVIIQSQGPILGRGFQDQHIRGASIGASMANIYKAMGWEVYRINYLQDWGKPMAYVCLGWIRHGLEAELARDPLGHLAKIYNSIVSASENETKERDEAIKQGLDTTVMDARGISELARDYQAKLLNRNEMRWRVLNMLHDSAVKGYEAAYGRMNVAFDEYSGQRSQFLSRTDMHLQVDRALNEKGLYKRKSNGSCVIDFKEHDAKHLGVAVFVDEGGERTSILWGIAAVIERYNEHAFDRMIYVCPTHNVSFLQTVVKTIELLGMHRLASRLRIVVCNTKSNVCQGLDKAESLDSVMDKSYSLVLASLGEVSPLYKDQAILSEVGRAAAACAVHFQYTRAFAKDAVMFNKQLFTFSTGSGPYIQYMHAYMKSRLPEEGSDETFSAVLAGLTPKSLDKYILANKHRVNLMRRLTQFPRAVATSYQESDPFEVMGYLVTLTEQVDDCITQGVMGGKGPLNSHPVNIALHLAVCQVLENGLRLLNVEPFDLTMIPRTPGHNGIPRPARSAVQNPITIDSLRIATLAMYLQQWNIGQ